MYQEKLRSRENLKALYGFFTLLTLPLVSSPNLIDGISYFKYACAILLISPMIPFYFYQIGLKSKSKSVAIFPIVLIGIISIPFLSGNQIYRNIFGAPGRNNGAISILIFSYYFLFGIFLKKTNQLRLMGRALYAISLITASSIIIISLFDVKSNFLLSALNLRRDDFRDNIDLFAILFCIGVICGFNAWRESKRKKYLLIILPIFSLTLWMNLMQVPLILSIAGISIFVLGKRKSNLYLKLFVFGIFFCYLIIVLILNHISISIDSSTRERQEILNFAIKLKSDFTILPTHIDALSDFSGNFPGNQFLDDFHNVYIQFAFSFGLLAGIFFFLLTIFPLIHSKLNEHESILIIPLNVSIVTGLLLGIVSPNNIFFVATILGYAVASGQLEVPQYTQKYLINLKLLCIIILPLILFPVAFQTYDMAKRLEISNLTRTRNLVSTFHHAELAELLNKTINFPDPGYKYFVAKNFYNIQSCASGDLIIQSMRNLNGKEVRLLALELAAGECRKSMGN